MYNLSSSNSLADVSVGDGVWLTLTPIDTPNQTSNKQKPTSNSLVFIVNPDEENWSFKADFAKLAVLNTQQPLVKYKTSETSLRLPKVRLYSPDNSKNLQPIIDSLASFTRPPKAGEEPPILKVEYGELSLPRVYLESCDVKVTARIGGAVAMAEASLSFVLAPEAQKVSVVEPPPGTTKTADSMLSPQTEREQSARYQKLVESLISNKFNALQSLSTENKKKLSGIDKAKLSQYTVKTLQDLGFSLNDKTGEFSLGNSKVFTKTQVESIVGTLKQEVKTPSGSKAEVQM